VAQQQLPVIGALNGHMPRDAPPGHIQYIRMAEPVQGVMTEEARRIFRRPGHFCFNGSAHALQGFPAGTAVDFKALRPSIGTGIIEQRVRAEGSRPEGGRIRADPPAQGTVRSSEHFLCKQVMGELIGHNCASLGME